MTEVCPDCKVVLVEYAEGLFDTSGPTETHVQGSKECLKRQIDYLATVAAELQRLLKRRGQEIKRLKPGTRSR